MVFRFDLPPVGSASAIEGLCVHRQGNLFAVGFPQASTAALRREISKHGLPAAVTRRAGVYRA